LCRAKVCPLESSVCHGIAAARGCELEKAKFNAADSQSPGKLDRRRQPNG
jgi:hypothetical protein